MKVFLHATIHSLLLSLIKKLLSKLWIRCQSVFLMWKDCCFLRGLNEIFLLIVDLNLLSLIYYIIRLQEISSCKARVFWCLFGRHKAFSFNFASENVSSHKEKRIRSRTRHCRRFVLRATQLLE